MMEHKPTQEDLQRGWQPIATVSEHIKDGDDFIARWKMPLFGWQYCIAYYGRFGHCFMRSPLGYIAASELENGLGSPEIKPEEWCEFPR